MTTSRGLPLGALAALALASSGCGRAGARAIPAASSSTRVGATPAIARAGPPPVRATTRPDNSAARRAVTRHSVVTRPPAIWRGVSVWLPYWSMSAAYQSATANANVVGTASPFWYAIAGDSTIEGDPGAGDASIIDGLRGHGISVVPAVTETDGMGAFDRTLASASRRAAMVRALVSIAASRAYSGLDLDFEDFAVDRGHRAMPAGEAAARYPAFVGQACAALHAIGRTCAVTVMPRTSGQPSYWRGDLATWVYDYAALSAVADRVQVMAYDEHAPGSAPGAVAPYAWVWRVATYVRATVAPDKAELALPAYGYDWSAGGATSITSREAAQLAAQNDVSPSWDPVRGEETFRYSAGGHQHTVWYEDGTAEYDRARLARAAGFAGVDLWAAGGEDPGVWPLLRALYAR